jgi:hypothetical protein
MRGTIPLNQVETAQNEIHIGPRRQDATYRITIPPGCQATRRTIGARDGAVVGTLALAVRANIRRT